MAPKPPEVKTPHSHDAWLVVLRETQTVNGIMTLKGQLGLIEKHNSDNTQISVIWREHEKEATGWVMKDRVELIARTPAGQGHGNDMKNFELLAKLSFANSEEEIPEGEVGVIIRHHKTDAKVLVSMTGYRGASFWMPLKQSDGSDFLRILHKHDLFPFRATHNCTSDDGNQYVNVGEEGKIFAHSANEKWVRVSIPRYNEPINIPRNRIEIGKRRMTERSWKLEREQEILAPSQITVTGIGQLWRTAFAFFKALQEQALNIPQMANAVTTLLGTGDTGPRRMADLIEQGCRKAGTFDELNSPDFTLKSICKAAQLVASNKIGDKLVIVPVKNLPSAIIYLIMHEDFAKAYRDPAIYVGETGNTSNRPSTHSSAAKDGRSYHYGIWRASVKHTMVNICNAPEGSGDDETSRFAIELFFIAAFEAYAPRLVKDFAKFLAESSATTTGLLASNIAVMGQGTETDDGDGKGVELVDFQDLAFRIMSIAEEVFKKTNWPRGTSRSQFGSSGGCNVETPLGSLAEGDVVFYKFRVPGKMEQYRRRPLTCWQHGSTLNVGHFHGGGIEFLLQTGKGMKTASVKGPMPKPGDKVYPVYEIWEMNGPVPPSPWARLPEDGQYDDHEQARRLRISIEWQDSDNGQWHKIYIQCSCEDQLTPDSPPRSYVLAMAIIHSLRQESVQDAEDWNISLRMYPVKTVEWNHLNQVLKISSSTSRHVSKPKKVNMLVRERELSKHGAKHFGTAFGVVPEPIKRGLGGVRKSCDRCFIGGAKIKQAELSGGDVPPYCDRQKCVAMDPSDKNSPCVACWTLHQIRCSWTRDTELTDGYAKAVLHETATPYSKQVDIINAPKAVDIDVAASSSRIVNLPYDEKAVDSILENPTLDKLGAVVRMCIQGVRENSDLSSSAGAIRRRQLLKSRELLLKGMPKDIKPVQQRKVDEFVRQIDQCHSYWGTAFTLTNFKDASGSKVQDRVPTLWELRKFIGDRQWSVSNRVLLKSLYLWFEDLGYILKVGVGQQCGLCYNTYNKVQTN
ncbi:hypothetical protein PRZ48_007793 [Zasmidium cellare]|uniref:GIY-YIG domain-containing protein n=1 Tax=Zasmidium cellare TaxID=395010 RepID=A0ABR0EME7_ZASCE|nr:hypothetical protein PRZ48_007793 [Zasmidium cellare]